MRLLVLTLICVIGLSWLDRRTAPGQEAAAIATRVQPYLEETTVAIVHADLSKIDIAAVTSWLQNRCGVSAEDTGQAEETASGLVRSLRDAGVTHAYATASTLDLAEGPVLYLACRDTDVVKGLVEKILGRLKNLRYETFVTDGLVVVARPATWKRISDKPNEGRDALTSTFNSNDQSALSLVINVPDRLRREVARVWPDRLPDEAPIDLSPSQVMSDVQSVVVTLRMPPQAFAEVRLQTNSEQALERSRKVLSRLTAALAKSDARPEITTADQSIRISASEPVLAAWLERICRPLRQSLAESQSVNNMKQILLAMHVYADMHKTLPPRETQSSSGAPLLSWRVHILPHIDQQALYNQFHLDEPWDSPHNIKLVPQMPAVYRTDAVPREQGKTRFVLPMLEGGAWSGDGPPLKFQQFTDGTSNTIAVVIGPKDKAVIWTKPEELPLDKDAIAEQLFGETDVITAGLFDGSVQHFPRDTAPENLRGLITIAGGERVSR